jgi:hypothetical protein
MAVAVSAVTTKVIALSSSSSQTTSFYYPSLNWNKIIIIYFSLVKTWLQSLNRN